MVQAAAVSSSMREFLVWLTVAERTYDETMDAWRTSCPRLALWEDASIGGYVEIEHAADGRSIVRVTAKGLEALAPA